MKCAMKSLQALWVKKLNLLIEKIMKKELILKAAAQLFSQKGYARTSTAQLAAQAGVAEGTIFRYFKNKEHVFITLVECLRDKMSYDVLQYLEIQGEQTSIERIVSIIKACYVFVNKNNVDFAILLRDAPGHYGDPNSAAFEHSRAIYVILQAHFQVAIEQGQKDNCIRKDLHPSDTACLLASSLVGLMRVVHLNFLQPTENMLKNFILCTISMLESKREDIN